MRLSFFPLFLLLAILGPGLISCEKDATIPPPPANPKLVLVSFLCPESEFLTATVNWSRPIFSSRNIPDPLIRDAQVRLQGPNVDVVLPFNANTDRYEIPLSSLNLVEGGTYTLTAREPGGTQVRAQTRIPEKRAWDFQADAYDSSQSAQMPGWVYYFRLRFRDPGPGKSYYRLGAYIRSQENWDQDSLGKYWQPLDFYLNDRFYESGPNPGQIYDIRISPQPGFIGNPDEEKFYSFHLLSANEDYFQYHNRLFNFEGDNPFAEAQTLYTNVEGGLGIFAAYREERKEIIKP